jgi:SAM-dependent methyltransferase
MPSLKWNRIWNDYEWPKDGDEWDGQARYCGQPYEAWKASVFETFIKENINPSTIALEVAAGHGRWSPYLIRHASRVYLADMNPDCIAFCKEKFKTHDHVSCHVNDGTTLPFLEPTSVDFIWSYDSFVHMEKDTIQSYFLEFARVLRPGGRAVIHHAGRRHLMLPLSWLDRFGTPGQWLYRVLSMKRDTAGGDDGDRSHVSGRLVRRMARRAGLAVLFQGDTWGDEDQYTCKRFNDLITRMEKRA